MFGIMKMLSDLLKSQYSSEGIMQGRKRSSIWPRFTLKSSHWYNLILYFFISCKNWMFLQYIYTIHLQIFSFSKIQQKFGIFWKSAKNHSKMNLAATRVGSASLRASRRPVNAGGLQTVSRRGLRTYNLMHSPHYSKYVHAFAIAIAVWLAFGSLLCHVSDWF